METFRITYKNYDLKHNAADRLKKDLKNLYWNKPPKDWDDFDGEIEVKEEQPRGGDCVSVVFAVGIGPVEINFHGGPGGDFVSVVFADTVNITFRDSILKNLSNRSDVSSVEKKISNNEYERIY